MTHKDLDPRFQEQYDAARRAGGWIPWACALLALAWWGGAAAYAFGKFGLDAILQTPWAELGGAFGLAFAPGMALIMAGFMGRESVRSSLTNALIMQSASHLMSPARGHAEDIRSLSDAIRSATSEVNDRLSEAERRIGELKTDMETSANAALKAAEIVRADSEALRSKLAVERDEFGALSDDLRRQLDTVSDALPKHAERISRSAQTAQEDMARAGAQLEERLAHIDETGRNLANRVAQLDQMTADTRKRAQNLVSALVSINEQLLNSSRTVDNAVKAGDLAVDASRTTADAIKSAMDSALDGGRDMVDRLTAQADAAKRAAQQALDQLNQTARAAEESVNRAMEAANKQADAVERRMDQLSARMFESATRATSAAEAGLDRARARIERATTLLSGLDDDGTPLPQTRIIAPNRPDHAQPDAPAAASDPQKPAQPQQPLAAAAPSPSPQSPRPTAPSSSSTTQGLGAQGLDDDILDPAPVNQPPPRISIQSLMPFDPLEDLEDEDDAFDPPAPTSTPQKPVASSAAPPRAPLAPQAPAPLPTQTAPQTPEEPTADIEAKSPDNMTWRDLLSGIDQPDSRHETALAFVDQLGRHGIRLKRAIRSADLRRIASAAGRGERHRRRATQQAAPGELQQIERLLRQDNDLRIAAQSYLAIEEPDALRVLAGAERAKDDAGPRLAAYLLLDAALGS